MMYKRGYFISIFLVIFLLLPMVNVKAEEQYILIIYDRYKPYATENNNLDKVVKMSLTTGCNVYAREFGVYTESEIVNAKGVVALSNLENSLDASQVETIKNSNENIIWIGKNIGVTEYIPLDKLSGIDELKVKKIIHDKFSVKPKQGSNTYMLIDDVYPVDDLNGLIDKADYLYKKGIPFLVNAMPVFQNENSEAMKRYVEALRFCQSKGGRIIFGSPYVYNKGMGEEEMIEKMKVAQDTFIDYFVYPIGMSLPNSYLYRWDRSEYLKQSSTFILSDDKEIGILNEGSYSFNALDNMITRIDLEDLEKGYNKEFYTDIAIPLVGNMPKEEFEKAIDKYIEMGISFSNPKYLKSEVYLGDNSIANRTNGISLNEKLISIDKFISNEQFSLIFEKEESQVKAPEVFSLKKINKVIIAISSIALVIFIILFLKNRQVDKRKYFK